MKTQNIIINEMTHFTGTVQYWEHRFFKVSLNLTDGADYIRKNCGAYWLFDLITQQTHNSDKSYVILLKKIEGYRFVFKVQDWTTNELVYKQEIPFSDFPLAQIKLYVLSGICLLPSEY